MSSHVCSEHAKQREAKYCPFCVIEYFKEINNDLRRRLKLASIPQKTVEQMMWHKRQNDRNF